MITVVLLMFAVLLTAGALRWLPTAVWVYRAPRLGIATWYAVLASVGVALTAAALEALLPLPGATSAWCTAVIWCADAMGGTHGPAAGITARIIATCLVAGAILLGVRLTRGALVLRRNRSGHRDMLRLAGRTCSDLSATVIEHAQPAAYVVPGGRVVVTSGAVQHLSPAQLAAVLAHERAHASEHHQALLDVLAVAATALPRVGVIATAREQVQRLIEIRADEVAAQHHSRADLAHALVTMASIPRQAVAPADMAAANGGDATERLHRLMRPPHRLPPIVTVWMWAALAALPAVPVVLAAACRWWPARASCLWVV